MGGLRVKKKSQSVRNANLHIGIKTKRIFIGKRFGKRQYVLIDEDDYLNVFRVKKKGKYKKPFVSWFPWRKDKFSTIYALSGLGKMHRYILCLKKNDGISTDHKNGDGLDNRRCNIRICTSRENSQNRKKDRTGKQRFKGVHFLTEKNFTHPYLAHIGFNGKTIKIGTFKTDKEAAKAYDKKAIELFGEFARTNF